MKANYNMLQSQSRLWWSNAATTKINDCRNYTCIRETQTNQSCGSAWGIKFITNFNIVLSFWICLFSSLGLCSSALLSHMWLSRVKSPHHLSLFFRDKAIQSELISTLLTTFYGQKTNAPQLPPHMGRLLRCSSPICVQDPRTNSKRTVPRSTYSTCSDFHLLIETPQHCHLITSSPDQFELCLRCDAMSLHVCLLLCVVGD